MKKSFLLILCFISLFFCSGCKNKKSTEIQSASELKNETVSKNNENETSSEIDLKEIQLTANIPCVVFYDYAYVWTLNESGTLDQYTKIYNGSELIAFPSDSDKIGEELESKELSRTGTTDTEVYTKILYDNKICWINSYVIAPYTIPGIVLDSMAESYKSPEISDDENDAVSQFQMVAINSNYVSPDENSLKLSKITYRSEDKSYRNVYIKTTSLSEYKDDVKAMMLLNKAAITEDRSVKEEILNSCMELNVSEEMRKKIEEDTETILYQYVPEE